MPNTDNWWVIVPLKDTRLAKSRLGGAPVERRELAIAMARDTLAAASKAEGVKGVVPVCARMADVHAFRRFAVRVLVRPCLSLNEAIAEAASAIRVEGAGRNLAVIPGDLPYLSSGELSAALEEAIRFASVCVADQSGQGTTLLTARAGTRIRPSYGVGSFGRHVAAGAVSLEVPAASGLRRDVDVREDLNSLSTISTFTRIVLQHQGAATGTTT